ncbi:MAG: LuxR C-terminal-related transcriptional regulator [Bacteroidota bacterium]
MTPDLAVQDQLVFPALCPHRYYYYICNFAEFKMDYVSDTYPSITGLNPSTFSFPQWLEAVHPEDVEFIQKCEKVAERFLFEILEPEQMLEYKVSYSYRMRDTDGHYFHALHQAMAISLTESKSLYHVLGIETNIGHLTHHPNKTISFIDLKSQQHYLNLDVENPQFVSTKELSYNFTHQELNILELISFGNSSKDIAETLNISAHTVRKHRENILRKSSASNITALVADLIRQGLL